MNTPEADAFTLIGLPCKRTKFIARAFNEVGNVGTNVMFRIGYRVATCGLSLAVMAAATAGAMGQAAPGKPAAAAPAAKAAPPAAKAAPPAARVAPPAFHPPAAVVRPAAPIVRQAPVARPAAPIIKQAPVAGPAGPVHPTFKQQNPTFQKQAPVAGPGTPPGPAFRQHQAPVAGPASPQAPASATTSAPNAAPRNNLGAVQQQNRTGRTFTRHPGMPAVGTTGSTASGAAASALVRGTDPASRFSRRDPNRVLRNQVFTNPRIIGRGSTLANTTFRGRFAANQANWTGRHHFHHNRVIGWAGPVFWPYAYYDMFDYAFWPYAYDSFWPYAYDDLYNGMFGPYAYGYADPGYGAGPGPGPGAGPATAGNETTGSLGLCANQATALTSWPMQKIAETVEPTGAQRAALDRLTQATSRAVGILKSACPTQLASTPTGRLAALQSRLQAMLRAVDTVAPALDEFYKSLNDEQRARFDSFGQEKDQNAAAQNGADESQKDLAQACSEGDKTVVLPLDRIEQDVRPNEGQRTGLDRLSEASQRAADILKANCPSETDLSAIARLDSMKKRLTTMLDAVNTVRPALDAFYNSLDYEQRARFNVIGAQEG